ncbi:MAG: hypothetical protein AB1752_11560 [Candidatus Zixiibacteriota bacterium]
MQNSKDKIEELLRRAEGMSAEVASLVASSPDYDLQRLLKKIDADLMDVRHNLNLARRLIGGME